MHRFFAAVRLHNVKPGEVLPHLGITLATLTALRSFGYAAETKVGVWILTAAGYRAAWYGFPAAAVGRPEITLSEVCNADG